MDAPPPFLNTLYFGDNLDILRDFVAPASVDLVYLDPPFNSNRDYNVLFREQSGTESPAQIQAFGDTWNWAGAASAWANFADLCPNPKVIELMHGFHNAIGENDVLAYLVMMAPRLFHLHRVLKPTGSLYLHVDPVAGHYLKLILDCIFGARNFKNEVIWQRVNSKGNVQRKFGAVHDVIYCYAKQNGKEIWNQLYRPLRADYIAQMYRYKDANGRLYRLDNLTASMQRASRGQIYEWRGKTPPPSRCWVYAKEKMDALDAQGRVYFSKTGYPSYIRYLDENLGEKITDIWDDIFQLSNAEALGYPTQKPLALLERIIAASSNPGDVVLDPFCGCGTAIVAAQKLERHWIGIDVTPIATSLIQKRLYDAFGAKDVYLGDKDSKKRPVAFAVEGLPRDVAGARELYARDGTHKDFEMWAVGLVPAIPQEKKGADQGIDGVAYFDVGTNKNAKAVVQVKGGGVKAGDVRDLRGVMTREGAALGLFVTLEPATKAMHSEALAAGFYKSPRGVGKQVPALQIRTVEELLDGRGFDFPITGADATFRKAAAVGSGSAGQTELFEKSEEGEA